MSKASRQGEAGFTLIEVLVAFLIASLVLTAAVQTTAAGLRQMRAAGEVRVATMHAQSALARLGADIPVQPGTLEARTPDGFVLRIVVRALPGAPRATVTPHTASISVAKEGSERSVSLETIVLGVVQ
jgi:prepilin-type N-terminal cleavage/methylation domain-containing protein